MKILLLGPKRDLLKNFLVASGDSVFEWEEKIDLPFLERNEIDFILSFGYRKIISREVIEKFQKKAVNLHISYLPWNRGADPNLWSFLEDTPKGVSIHFIDEAIDTGPIICQREVGFFPEDTLRTTYDRLIEEIQALFRANWQEIREGKFAGIPQPAGGSFHKSSDRKPYEKLLTDGWDTPVISIIGKAKKSIASS